jgi:ABC-2 type transport system permease protein
MKKELRTFFKSPMAYIIAGLFAAITGYVFYNLLISFVENTQNIPGQYKTKLDFINAVIIQLFSNINLFLLFFCPILTMRMFAEEKKESTIDLYFSAPVKDYELVLGKFFATIIMGCFLLSITLIYPVILWSIQASDFSFIISGYLGLFLNMTSYLALGLFASSLTSNQIVASVISYVGIMGFWVISWASQISTNYIYSEFFKYIAIVRHFEMFVKGITSTSDLVFYFSFIFVWIFLTKKVIESRNW